ncbi:hypothetical protein [[Mycobacterium] crassicus]|uniref:Uncharacterized protein n=1 Tax=[Mycobacterium] crassicus TaxID=2872309 RepID=A0ABU5XKK4_9MYCO|nr:hypothetical protein [Mycolicibacter sp. MYC098]MEB3022544.1 hypothetical protein [Mycolicibacter sp. MYC098]
MSTGVSFLRTPAPDPADADPARGWCGVITAIVSGRVIGELWEHHGTDRTVTHDAGINIDGRRDRGSLIKTGDPKVLRNLAAVACLLAAELDRLSGDPEDQS